MASDTTSEPEILAFELIPPEDSSPLQRLKWDVLFRFGIEQTAAAVADPVDPSAPLAQTSDTLAPDASHAASSRSSGTPSLSRTTSSALPGLSPGMSASGTARGPRRLTPEPGRRSAHTVLPTRGGNSPNLDISHIFPGPTPVAEPLVGNLMQANHDGASLRQQTYHVQITVQGKLFQPAIDTCTNTSWLRAAGAAVLRWDRRKNKYILATEQEIRAYSEESPPMHVTLSGYEPYYRGGTESAIHGSVEYGDKSAVWLGVRPDRKENCTFQQCYTFTESRATRTPISKKIAFGFAYAHSLIWKFRVADGLLAFGVLDHYSPSRFDAPTTIRNHTVSIMKAFGHPLVKSPSGGFSLFFALQSPANGDVKSLMLINGWPQSQSVHWSDSIPVVSGSPHWTVRWLSFKIAVAHTPPVGSTKFIDVPGTQYTFDPDNNGINVSLDTGSSSSWVPLAFVTHLRTQVFPSPDNQAIEEEWGNTTPIFGKPETPYIVNDGEKFNGVDTGSIPVVILTFAGRNGPVEVPCGVDDFLVSRGGNAYQPPPSRTGLLNASPPSLEGDHILGLNFFQTMFVALHKDANNDPYVRLADRLSGRTALSFVL